MKMQFWLAGMALALLSGTASAQYPSKAVTMVVPFAAGGPTDTLGRNLGIAMGKPLKQAIVIENVGGAGGNIGVLRVAKAAPDGYTVLLHHIGMSTSPALYRKLDYNPLTDFEYIGLVADVPMTLIARGNFPASNFKEFLTYIKANKAKITLANAGLGAASHLCGLLFMTAIETDFTTVPYKGTGPAMNDLLGGQVDFMCDQTTNTTGQIQGGKVKAYGVTTKTRVPSLSNIPTLEEQGMKGFEVAVWHAIYAPKGTPKAAVDTLVRALQEALRDPDLKTNLGKLGTEPTTQARATPEALRSHLKAEIDKWGPVIKKAGQYAD
ncbi:MAG: tripartite tricarboxylate transporter substrate binding protein BugD [Betaproteobacteria bacterium]|nr:tripartite tricarboxylate transporter substrate binding protein BugD [Betaproteobacteria bacterium]